MAPDVVRAEGPVEGVKFAAIVEVDGQLRFRATTVRPGHSPCYDVHAQATCQLGADHRAPAWNCTCGFYAMRDTQGLDRSWLGHVQHEWGRLRVELRGRVVEHEHGWRASHQVVHEVSYSDACRRCSTHRADGFVIDGAGRTSVPVLMPVCRSCAGPAGLLSLGEVAGRLGTDVRLTPSSGPPQRSDSAPPPPRARRGQCWRTLLAGAPFAVTAALLLVAALRHDDTPESGGATETVDVVAELRRLVRRDDGALTASLLAERFDGLPVAARAIVDPPDQKGMRRLRAVAFVDTGADGRPRCRVIEVGHTPPQALEVIELPGQRADACVEAAIERLSPRVV